MAMPDKSQNLVQYPAGLPHISLLQLRSTQDYLPMELTAATA